MPTIKDVAKLAGVSVATVSRVINEQTNVKENTREKVYRAIKDLDYQPNLLGRNLRKSETKKILVILPSISNTFYSKIIKGIEDAGNDNGYNIMICNSHSDIKLEKNYLDLLQSHLIDGIIFMSSELSSDELTQINKKYPIVQCCEYGETPEVSKVGIDNTQAAYDAVKYLIKSGHERIALINGYNNYQSTIKREQGYKQALIDCGLNVDDNLIKYNSFSFKGGVRAAKQLLNLSPLPTAIFAVADAMAIGAMREITQQGLKIGKDIAIIGFDNTGMSSMITPSLTTIGQPRYDLGQMAMKLLLERIKNLNLKSKKIILEHELIIRESTLPFI